MSVDCCVLEHCHGTLVRHRDGAAECTDPDCRAPGPERHELVVACVVLAACGCENGTD